MAGAVIGALRVELGLNSAQFQNGLKSSQSGLQKFAAKAKVAAAVAVAAMAGMAAKMTKDGLSFIDSQAKMARSVDGTIDGLRALQQAGGDAGVGADDVGAAMQKLGRRLADAASIGGPAADALDRIGLSAGELLTMDADERLAAIADKAKSLGMSAQETAGLLGELGIKNASMALLVMQGGDAIRAARSEIEAMGLSISAVDAAKVESANDAFSRMGFVTEAVSNRLAIAFAPALQAISVAFVSLMQEGGGLRVVIDALGANIGTIASVAASFATFMAVRWVAGFVMAAGATTGLTGGLALLRGAIMRTGFGALIIGAGYLVEWFARLVSKAGGFGNALSLLKAVAVEVFQRIGDGFAIVPAAFNAGSAKMKAFFIGGLAAMAQAFVDFTADVTDGLNAIFNTNLQPLGAGMVTELNRVTAAADAAAGAATGALSGLVAAATAPLGSLQALRDTMSATDDATAGASDSAADLAAQLAALDDAGDGGGGGGAADAGGGGSAAAGSGAAAKKVKKVKEAVEELSEEMTRVKDLGKEAFTGLVTGAKSLTESIAGVLAGFAEMLASQAYNALWSAGLSAIGGGIGGVAVPAIGANANGTPNWRGGLTRINERGGELVNLPGGSQIIPATRLGGMDGGQIDLVLHVPEGVTLQDVRQEAANVSVRVVQQNNQSLIEKQRRP
jgi:hypothetical protein